MGGAGRSEDHHIEARDGGEGVGGAHVAEEAGAERRHGAAREELAVGGGGEGGDGEACVGGGVGEELAAGAVVAHDVEDADGGGEADGGVVLVRGDGPVRVPQLRARARARGALLSTLSARARSVFRC